MKKSWAARAQLEREQQQVLASRKLFRPKFPEMPEMCASCPFREGNDKELDAVLAKLAAANDVPEETRLPVTVARAMVKQDVAAFGDFYCHGSAYDATLKNRTEQHKTRQCKGATEWYRTHLPVSREVSSDGT